MMEYQEYIDSLGLDRRSAYGKCEFYSKKMIKRFPELILVRGHYDDPIRGATEHWWLKTEVGKIVDPTKAQFISGFDYTELDKNSPEPTGKCPECGEYVYNNQTLHDECAKSYLAYLNSV